VSAGHHITCVTDAVCLLGESPVWDWRTGALYFVDIKDPAVHCLDPQTGASRRWPMPEMIGSIGLRQRGGLVAALKSGFAFIDLAAGHVTRIADPEAGRPGNRFNDGKVDPAGRFWAGTMDDGELLASGDLYRLDADLSVRRFAAGFVVTNGVEWSNDGRTLYFVDSAARRILAYGFEMGDGLLGAPRLFAAVDPSQGFPDGLAVDADDHVWSAHWNGARITRYRPDGSTERVIAMPVPLCTNCCFGGADLTTLFVTSASIGLDAAARLRAPQSGRVFAVTGLGVRGRPAHLFAR
jgi:sugar lactone lactonase YvrE